MRRGRKSALVKVLLDETHVKAVNTLPGGSKDTALIVDAMHMIQNGLFVLERPLLMSREDTRPFCSQMFHLRHQASTFVVIDMITNPALNLGKGYTDLEGKNQIV